MTFRTAWVLLAAMALIAALFAACGGDDNSATQTPGGSGSSSAAPVPTSRVVPPLEGPERPAYTGEQIDFRNDPAYKMPGPLDVPKPTDTSDPVVNPPAQPDCPSEWKTFTRVPEGFEMCYPEDWTVATDAYKNAPGESRWYAAGIFKFPGSDPVNQLAHVSVYVIPYGARPFPYTKDCPAPVSVILDGQPAVACPSFPVESPEARLISYHVYRDNLDYFFNITTYYKYDDSKGAYTQETDQEAFDTALKIIGSVKFTLIPSPVTGEPSPSPTG